MEILATNRLMSRKRHRYVTTYPDPDKYPQIMLTRVSHYPLYRFHKQLYVYVVPRRWRD